MSRCINLVLFIILLTAKLHSATMSFHIDSTSAIRNPAMGWVLYIDAFAGPDPVSDGFPNAEDYWEQQDPYVANASILYIRAPWAQFEPTEGNYSWVNDQNYKNLINGALDRGLKLAFRIYVHGMDCYREATPTFVRDSGCKGYDFEVIGNDTIPISWTPHTFDPIFKDKFSNFIRAFAAEYNKPDIVDFIDGEGLGWWGEMHHINYLSTQQKNDVYNWITNLYKDNFSRILIGIIYASPWSDYGEVHSFPIELQNSALKDNGFIIRRDSYGNIQPPIDKELIKNHWPMIPVYAENWDRNFDSWQTIPNQPFGTLREYLTAVIREAEECHANTLDLRRPADTEIWHTETPDLVDYFVKNGGYRLSPLTITYPTSIYSEGQFIIDHTWKNIGFGRLPNDRHGWNYKYKVAFALLNKANGKVVFQTHVAEPSTWVKGKTYRYRTPVSFHYVSAGVYDLAVSIVDEARMNLPTIKLATTQKPINGWYKIGTVNVFSNQPIPAPKYENLAPSAYISTNIPSDDGRMISMLNNGDYSSSSDAWISNSFFFKKSSPQFISLDMGEKLVEFTELQLIHNPFYVGNFKIQVLENGIWVNKTLTKTTISNGTKLSMNGPIKSKKIRIDIDNWKDKYGGYQSVVLHEILLFGIEQRPLKIKQSIDLLLK